DALARVEALRGELTDDDDAALRAQVLRAHGNMLRRTGKPEAAQTLLGEAMVLAGATGDDAGAAKAALSLMFTLSDESDRHAEALLVGKTAELLVRRLEPEPGPLTAEYLQTLALALTRKRDYEEAATRSQEAIALLEREYGALHPRTIDAVSTYAVQLIERGDPEGEALTRRVLEDRREVLGAGHPKVTDALNNLGAALANRGAFAESAELHRRCYELRVVALGPEHPRTLSALGNLSDSLMHTALADLPE
ncbi:MAG: tetratricopeptide repeat protein, partial [Myxococcales bacterium]|nr:tetratricopeptide repeat protein [Myxococcales bacterium]